MNWESKYDDQDLLEYDIYVSMPPKRRYIVTLKIREIRKGEPRIIVPEYLEWRIAE